MDVIADDDGLVDHLRALEEALLRPEVRRSREALASLLAPDFTEIGRSGRHWDRDSIVDALADETPAPVRVEAFTVRRLAPALALATYRSVREDPAGGPSITTLRSSTWRREADGAWRLTFHQGTPAAGAPG